MSARERIAAAVERVRAGEAIEKVARALRMTPDVLRKACSEAGIADPGLRPKPGRRLKTAFEEFSLYRAPDRAFEERRKDLTRKSMEGFRRQIGRGH